jgi:S1-C subfamily serine protease
LSGYGEHPYAGYGYPALGGQGQPGSTAGSGQHKGRRRLIAASGLVAALAIGVGAYALGSSSTNSVSGLGSGAAGSSSAGGGSASSGSGSSGSGSSGSGSGGNGFGGYGGYGGYGGFGGSSGTGGTGTTTSAGSATAAEQVGVVDINTVLKYQNAEAAGTGMILTSTGEILTNNHVIDGATSITVTVVSTGKTYTATVVGDDPTADVAVLQLSGASGLKTVSIGKSSTVTVGESVIAVGNAGGAGGVPSAVAGTVEALNQSITASDDNGSDSEQLTGMIMSNAPIQAGDSGGPLYNSAGQVIGMDTAGNAASDETAATQAYSIPISTALSVAAQIESGKASSTVNIGYPAFLGIELTSGSGSTQIADVISGSAAEQAGLAAGDTITAIAGTAVATNTQLQAALATYKPGQTVTISWTDESGASHSAKVTLMTGPAA